MDRLGWLANGINGKIHFYLEDEFSTAHRVSLCGRKHHQFSIVEPIDQPYCALCTKFGEREGIPTPLHTKV